MGWMEREDGKILGKHSSLISLCYLYVEAMLMETSFEFQINILLGNTRVASIVSQPNSSIKSKC